MASVNGKQVYQLPEALFFPTVRIVAESGGLYVSNADGRTKLVLNLRNVGMDTLSALQISVRCMDAFGGDLGEFQHQYIDLEAGSGKGFGGSVMVDVPQGNTRSVTVMIDAAIYTNGTSWRQGRGEAGLPLPKAQPLPYGPDALDEFRNRTGCMKAVDLPQTAEGLWRCTCGAWNTEYSLRCGDCGTERSALRQLPGEEELRNAAIARQQAAQRAAEAARLQAENARKAEEARLRVEREEAERQAKEEEKKRKKKKRRKTRRILLTIFLIIVAAAFPMIRFVGAHFLNEYGYPELAYTLSHILPEYNYIPEDVVAEENSIFCAAMGDKAMEAGDLDKARKYYAEIGYADGDDDAVKRAKAAKAYFAGRDDEAAGKSSEAIAHYLESGAFYDAPVRYAELSAAAGKYRAAVNHLLSQTDCQDALTALREKYPQVDYVWHVLNYEPIIFGSQITYGGNVTFDQEPIEWVRVPGSAAEDGVYLIATKNLFSRNWHDQSTAFDWVNSSLRTYLNNGFLNSSFDENERGAIIAKSYPSYTTAEIRYAVKWDWPTNANYQTEYVTLPSVTDAYDYYLTYKYAQDKPGDELLMYSAAVTNEEYFWSRTISSDDGRAGVLPLKIENNKPTRMTGTIEGWSNVRPCITVDVDKLAEMYVKAQACDALIAEGKYDEAAAGLQTVGSLGLNPRLYVAAMTTLEEVRSSDADLQTRIGMYETAVNAFDHTQGYLNTDAEYERAAYEIGLLYAEAGRTEDAIKALGFAAGYQDAMQQLTTIVLAKAEAMSAEGKYLEANEWLSKQPVEVAPEIYQANTLAAAEALRGKGEYLAANELLAELPADMVADKINDNLCAEAEALLTQGKYVEAQRILKDVATLPRAEELLAHPAFAAVETVCAQKTMTFGAYEQDDVKTNGAEAIVWDVLHVNENDGTVLLISHDLLDRHAWGKNDKNWKNSDLRAWLNDTFYQEAFSYSEKQMMRTKTITSDVISGDKETTDHVWLLSLHEAATYYSTVEESKAVFSEYAENMVNGWEPYWWLRDVKSSGAVVMPFNTYTGNTYNYRMLSIENVLGVRPVIAVDVNKLADQFMAEQEALAFVAAGDYAQAVEILEKANSSARGLKAYAEAMVLKAKVKPDANKVQNKLRLEYIAKLQEANGYADSADLYNQACYEHAVALTKLGDYRGAMEYYGKCGAYEDAAAKAMDLQLQVVRQLIDERKYTEAYNKLVAMADNAGAQELLKTDSHMVTYAAFLNQLVAGSSYTFGSFEQDSSRSNGAEPIQWRVLTQTEDGRVLLLSEKILIHKPFGSKKATTWPNSTLRTWLNGTFLTEAFNAEEQAALCVTMNNGKTGNGDWGYATEEVEDRVFLLSLDEAARYFSTAAATKATCTDYAKDTYPYSNTQNMQYWMSRTTSTNALAMLPISSMSEDGLSYNFSTTDDMTDSYGVRPAVWVSIEQLVSAGSAEADGRALMESGDYEAALKVLELSSTDEAVAALKETCFLLGEKLMAEGSYEEACANFERAADHPGAAGRLQEARYALAAEQEAAGKYTEAIENYTLTNGLKDAADRILACHYKNGMALLEKKQFDAAVEALTLAGDTENAKEMILRAWYEKAEKLEKEQDYAGAVEHFALAEGWQNAADRQVESRYLLANQMIGNEQYIKAQEQLGLLGEYKDAAVLVQQYKDAAHAETVRKAWTVGQYVELGTYEQDGVEMTGEEPIRWRVLDVQGDRVLLLSEKILAYRAFDASSNRWVTSSLRAWLNGEFRQTAFSAEEMQCLMLQTQYNGKNYSISSKLRNEEDTEDYVFLLNLNEAVKYFSSVDDSRVTQTDYAWKLRSAYNKKSEYSTTWWLRVPYQNDYVVYMPFTKYEESSQSFSALSYSNASVGVRPAIWVDLTKIIEMTR